MGPPASHGVPRAPCYSGTPTVTEGLQRRLRDYHPVSWAFPDPSANRSAPILRPATPGLPPVWALPRSLATTDGIDSHYFPADTEMFHFSACRDTNPMNSDWNDAVNGARFPHSEIFGSKRACRSPKLIAACCVLRRLMKPRHPSIAVTGLCKRSIF